MVARVALLASLLIAVPAAAQNWSTDARRIALGGVGDARNPALELVEEQRGYGTIILPFGLFRVLQDFSIYDPGDDNFDPVRAAEYGASPLHYTFDRNGSNSGQRFINDIVNARISPNLNVYRGFQPANEFFGEGLAAPSWGKTFRFREEVDGAFQGVYVGVGPYLSVETDNRIDQGFIDLLGSDADVFVPNATFFITDETVDQFALAITGGYRARFPLPGRSTMSGRDGMYIAANYNYLYGFHYDDLDMDIRFETDAAGLLTVAPTTTPVAIERLTADTPDAALRWISASRSSWTAGTLGLPRPGWQTGSCGSRSSAKVSYSAACSMAGTLSRHRWGHLAKTGRSSCR